MNTPDKPALRHTLTHHLNTVDEGYFQHMGHALSFAVTLFAAALVCLIHAFLPWCCEKRGSEMVTRLHDRMVTNRLRLSPRRSQASTPAEPVRKAA